MNTGDVGEAPVILIGPPRAFPVVVFTTSKAEEDIYKTYELGVSSFITKPVTFSSLIDVMKTLGKYWFDIVVLPEDKR